MRSSCSRLLIEDRFPRIWVADAANRDLRQLFWHRHRLLQMRTRIMNQLHVVALNEGVRRKKALWRPAGRSELESLLLAPWAKRRRQDLLDLLDQFTPKIQQLTRALEEEVEKRPVTRRLMTHPGVGPLTALAFELVIETPERFHCGKQIASYEFLASVALWEDSLDQARGFQEIAELNYPPAPIRNSVRIEFDASHHPQRLAWPVVRGAAQSLHPILLAIPISLTLR